MRLRVSLFACFASALVFAKSLPAADGAAKLPLVYEDDFDKGADHWQPTDKSQWTLKKTDAGYVYSQHKKESKYKPPHRSPLNISLLADVVVGDMLLDVRALSTHPDYGHRDVVLVFGYQDAAHFYYVHLGKQADDHANQIFVVDGAPRTKISTKSTSGTHWDDKWHHLRVVRGAGDGAIAVFFDDLKTPVMTATDKRFPAGRIGLGTFDDTADFDDLKLYGNKVEKKEKK